MNVQLSPEELIVLYKSLLLNGGSDDAYLSLFRKIEDSIMNCLLKQEDARNHGAYESWVESENEKISTLKNELDNITKGILLTEKKSVKMTSLKPSKRGRPKKD